MKSHPTLKRQCSKAFQNIKEQSSSYLASSISGLRLADTPSKEDIVRQSRMLCQDYIFTHLRKDGLLSTRLELRGMTVRATDVSQEIQVLGSELDKMYPELYHNISKQLNIIMTSEKVVRSTFLAIAGQLLKNTKNITWARVVALFAIANGMATDCVHQGHPDFVFEVVDSFEQATKEHLVDWIARQGGWNDIVRAFRTPRDSAVVWMISVAGAVVGFFVTLLATIRL